MGHILSGGWYSDSSSKLSTSHAWSLPRLDALLSAEESLDTQSSYLGTCITGGKRQIWDQTIMLDEKFQELDTFWFRSWSAEEAVGSVLPWHLFCFSLIFNKMSIWSLCGHEGDVGFEWTGDCADNSPHNRHTCKRQPLLARNSKNYITRNILIVGDISYKRWFCWICPRSNRHCFACM